MAYVCYIQIGAKTHLGRDMETVGEAIMISRGREQVGSVVQRMFKSKFSKKTVSGPGNKVHETSTMDREFQ